MSIILTNPLHVQSFDDNSPCMPTFLSPWGKTLIGALKRVGIIATMFENMQNHLHSDLFAAVAVLNGNKRLEK